MKSFTQWLSRPRKIQGVNKRKQIFPPTVCICYNPTSACVHNQAYYWLRNFLTYTAPHLPSFSVTNDFITVRLLFGSKGPSNIKAPG